MDDAARRRWAARFGDRAGQKSKARAIEPRIDRSGTRFCHLCETDSRCSLPSQTPNATNQPPASAGIFLRASRVTFLVAPTRHEFPSPPAPLPPCRRPPLRRQPPARTQCGERGEEKHSHSTGGWLGSALRRPQCAETPGGEPQTVRPQPPGRRRDKAVLRANLLPSPLAGEGLGVRGIRTRAPAGGRAFMRTASVARTR